MMDFTPGTEVYWMDAYGTIRGGFTTEKEDIPDTYIHVAATYPYKGYFTVEKKQCYPTHEACLKAAEERSKQKVNRLMKQIHSAEDLARFCFTHTVSRTEEYTDWDARKAAVLAAEKLGISGITDND